MSGFTNGFVDLVTYVANGALATAYFLGERAPHLLSIAAALLIALTFDRLMQEQAVFAPARYAGRASTLRHAQGRPPRTAQITTGVALALWLAATWSFGPPVPYIGAAMWLTAFVALLIMPQQRWSLLWTTKAGIVLYSLTVLGFRLYLWQASQMSPSQLAEVFGSSTGAARIITQNTSALSAIGSWLLWVIMPAGYVGVLIQNWAVQPMSLGGPLAGAKDVLTTLRTRNNEQSTMNNE
ncbi:MAG: hypothetical protein AAB427_03780 [Chloroflexota bacterium]